MNGIQLFFKEIKNIFQNKKILVQLIAILFVPVLYSGMFLWAFWDPYNKMDSLPVAVINLDKGATYNDKKINIGKDLVDNLKENETFRWEFVDDKTGINGLENQDYYMVVRIPSDFSKEATTLLDENPKQLSLEYIPNEGYNFLSSQIGETAIIKIKDEVASSLSKTYAETMFDSVKEMADGIKDASDGADKINDGTTEAKDGSKKLRDNLQTLAKSSITFEQGMSTAYSGSKDLNSGLKTLNSASQQLVNGQQSILDGTKGLQDGTNQLYTGLKSSKNGVDSINSNMGSLVNGSQQLNGGLTSISTGASQLSKGSQDLSTGANNVHDGIVQLKNQLNGMLPLLPEDQKQKYSAVINQLSSSLDQLEAGSKQVADGATNISSKSKELSSGASTLASNMGTLNQGISQVAGGINQVAQGQDQLLNGSQSLLQGQTQLSTGVETITGKMKEFNSGVNKVTTGSDSLTSGLSKLDDGAKSISSGSGQLAAGAKDLTSGLTTLNDGTSEMATSLKDATEKTSDINSTSDKNYTMFSDPVGYNVEKVNPVPNYGTGFAPYFLSLGLFVGALILTIIFDLKTPIDEPKSVISTFISKLGIILIVGTIQALIADAILLFGLGLEVQNTGYFVLMSIITSITFLTLIQMLVTWIGDVGRFVAVILLILQLTTSAGTFPLELIPDKLKIFNNLLPMTYSIRGFKAVISSGNYDVMWHNINILLMFIGGMCLISLLYFATHIKKIRNKSEVAHSEI
ncbi:MAG: YhgE/Pip family protein [Peptostreptococcaceae bacterium]